MGIQCENNSSPIITFNNITNNTNGIYCLDGSNATIHWNNIHNNKEYGVRNFDSTITINATNNWWGHSSGPRHPSNPGFGDRVSDYVRYNPWLSDSVKEAGPG